MHMSKCFPVFWDLSARHYTTLHKLILLKVDLKQPWLSVVSTASHVHVLSPQDIVRCNVWSWYLLWMSPAIIRWDTSQFGWKSWTKKAILISVHKDFKWLGLTGKTILTQSCQLQTGEQFFFLIKPPVLLNLILSLSIVCRHFPGCLAFWSWQPAAASRESEKWSIPHATLYTSWLPSFAQRNDRSQLWQETNGKKGTCHYYQH